MYVSDMLSGLSTNNIVNRLSRSKPESKPYRIWILLNEDGNEKAVPKPFGICACSLEDLKQKAWKITDQYKKDGNIVERDLTVKRMDDETVIMDDDYLKLIPSSEDLIFLLPGQIWDFPVVSTTVNAANILDSSVRRVDRRTSPSACDGDYDHRYHVSTPCGEIARLTLDVYREKPDDAGCVRFHAVSAGDAGITVAYELRLHGAKAVLQYAIKWSAVFLTYVGQLMINSGELLKKYFA